MTSCDACRELVTADKSLSFRYRIVDKHRYLEVVTESDQITHRDNVAKKQEEWIARVICLPCCAAISAAFWDSVPGKTRKFTNLCATEKTE